MRNDSYDPEPGAEAVFLPHAALPARGRFALYRLDGAELGDLGALQPLDLAPDRLRLAVPCPDGPPRIRQVDVGTVDLDSALTALSRLHADTPARPSVRVWALAARLAVGLVAARRLVPALLRTQDDEVVGVWRAATDEPDVADALARLAAAMPRAGHALALGETGEERVWAPGMLVRAFLDAVVDLAVRDGGPPPRPGRPRARLLPWTARWAEALSDPMDPTVPLRDDADDLVAAVAAWSGDDLVEEPTGTAEFRLNAPESQDGKWRLEFGVRGDDGAYVPATAVWDGERQDADGQGGDGEDGEGIGGVPTAHQQTLLRGLGQAARVFPALEPALRAAAPVGLDLDLDQAWLLLDGAAQRLTELGLVMVLPQGLGTSDLALRLRVGDETVDPERVAAEGLGPETDQDDEQDDRDPTQAELDELVLAGARDRRGPGTSGAAGSGLFAGLLTGFRWEVALGGETLTAEEFEAIVETKAPLVRFRERWVRVDPERVGRLRRLGPPGELPLAEALALGLAGRERAGERGLADSDTDGQDETVEVVAVGGVAVLVDRLREATERPPVAPTPTGFVGLLRPYQRRGVSWLQGMGELGLGAVLADEMGLGKTVQLAAYLLLLPPAARHLVVCPTSVLGNWQRELARFAPSLTVTRHHGPDRERDLRAADGVVLTTYGTLRRDAEVLAKVGWDVVALDEAQQVKNPGTAGARAVRRLRARQTVALTGTPLENRLVELWSLLDATNPGLLGSRTRFGRRFVTPIEQRRDADAARRLRRLVAPFVLRRSKRDPAIIADLPDKIERTVVTPLTPEQAALYQAAVERVLGGTLDKASAIERRGRILALLTELKQICNHPAQYLRERGRGGPAPVLAGRSGKLATAREIIGEATGGGAQVLCFTQYVEMGHLLVAQLSADLGVDVPFLHGAVPAAQRDRMVASFQGEEEGRPPPVMVVSLRAGGTGLNLTAATHVLHYDRWWNPAVEDQATDRAHRIGQTETVEVHKLVTAGTVEERVAEVLERKRSLAETVVGAGESWVTELGDAELGELVALAADAPVTELDDEPEWSGGLVGSGPWGTR